MHLRRLGIYALLSLLLFSACRHEREPSISEVLPFDDADVEMVEFIYCTIERNSEEAKAINVDLLITGQEDIDHILSTLRALEPISYNDSGLCRNGNGAFFVFHMEDGRLYTVGYLPALSNIEGAASLENDVARINVPFDDDFLYELAHLEYENIYPQNKFTPVELDIPVYGYSNPGDPPMEANPYVWGSSPPWN